MTERTPQEWAEVAVSLPGWQWLKGMQTLPFLSVALPDPDDPATSGCLIELLSPSDIAVYIDREYRPGIYMIDRWFDSDKDPVRYESSSVGRCAILVAESLGRWPRKPV
jgi:hypothetical protein